MDMATKRKQAKKRRTKTKRKGVPDRGLLLVGIVALLIALVAFYLMGDSKIFWYGMAGAIGVALLYEAYN